MWINRLVHCEFVCHQTQDEPCWISPKSVHLSSILVCNQRGFREAHKYLMVPFSDISGGLPLFLEAPSTALMNY